jgi:hypothetical protein
MELDNHNIVSIPVSCDGSAFKAEVGFNPRKVEVVAAGGFCALAYSNATHAMKLASSAALVSGLVTFSGDNTVTLGTDADLNVSGTVTTLLCYK